MSEELKPCPFCGGEADIRWHQSDCFVVSCTVCCAEGPPASGDEMQAAIAAWNTRAEPEAAPVEPGTTDVLGRMAELKSRISAEDWSTICDYVLGERELAASLYAHPPAAPTDALVEKIIRAVASTYSRSPILEPEEARAALAANAGGWKQ